MEEDFILFKKIKEKPIRDCVDLSRNMIGRKNGFIYFTENFRIDFENKMQKLVLMQNELSEKTEQVKMLDEAYSGAIKESKKWFDIAKNSVPKEILRNVIKELKNEISKNNKMIVEYRSTIEENRLEKEAKIDKARFDNLIYDNEIRILEEILGE